MSKFSVTNKIFQFSVMWLFVIASFAYATGESGKAMAWSLLYGVPAGYVVAEIWVASLIQGETKKWIWFPAIRGYLRRQPA
ncbi:hypothetical protein [Methylobacterium aquaticum]|uniref:hypothetical protein n=1 Tax=Methylobacterium aquaticum TaxID=270351 RepID=UPI001934879E|nr:hypothetical protein [Methylobacterium aquaticum]QRE76820.1 hypothetical protein F1D61_27645 [Methylobacterium aquaticum]